MLGGRVDYPISYAPYFLRLVTTSAGLRLQQQITDKISVQFSGGVEFDVSKKASAYAGSSEIVGFESFTVAPNYEYSRFRANAAVGASYKLDVQASLFSNLTARTQAFSRQLAYQSLIGYRFVF